MENKGYREGDVNLDVLKGKVNAVLGYGIQGRSQALNMRDNGVNVIVGARESKRPKSGWEMAQEDEFHTMSIAEAVKAADVAMVLLADPALPAVYYEAIYALNTVSMCFMA